MRCVCPVGRGRGEDSGNVHVGKGGGGGNWGMMGFLYVLGGGMSLWCYVCSMFVFFSCIINVLKINKKLITKKKRR